MRKKISNNREKQAHFEMMLDNGESERFAEMIALQKAPYAKPDYVVHRLNQDKPSPVDDYCRQVAESLGCSTTGKTYVSQLADFPGDPLAFVSDEHDIKRVCQLKGKSTEGLVDYTYDGPLPTPAPAVGAPADDIVEAEMWRRAEENPDIMLRPAAEVKEQVREELSRATLAPVPKVSKEEKLATLRQMLPDTLE